MRNGIVLFFSIIILSSCSKKLSPFTQQLEREFSWSDRELEQIQFYLSEDVYLWRDRGREESVIENGKIKILDGREVEEVVIKKGTPGVFLFSPGKERYAISFDSDDDKYLMFGPNKKANGKYVLLAKEWKRRQGKVTYGGRLFNTTNRSAYAGLQVDIDSAKKVQFESSRASGRKVGN